VNALLAYVGETLVREMQVLNPFNPKTFLTDKRSIIDIKAVATDDRQFVIEFQTSWYDSFVKRLLYNWAKTLCLQLSEGKHYRSLLPVVEIAMLNYTIFDELPDLLNLFCIVAKSNPSYVLSNDFQLYTLEFVDKKIDQISLYPRPLRDWMIFFWYSDKKTEAEMKMLLKDSDSMVQSSYDKYRFFIQDEDLRLLEMMRQQAVYDRASELDYATRKGREEGTIATARNLKYLGVDIETIMKATGLSAGEIDLLD
jgi:predicted transposase/invertase (TIGR01784 family)